MRAKRISRLGLTGALLAAALLAAGCAHKARRTAHDIASGYEIIEGEAARLLKNHPNLDELLKTGRATKRTYAEGEGKNRIQVTETLVLGKPFRVDVDFLRYFDPIADVPDGRVARIVYKEDRNGEFDIRDPADARNILRTLRTESYVPDHETCYGSYADGDEAVTILILSSGPGTPLPTKHPCSRGFWIHAADGKVVHLCGLAKWGGFSAYRLRGDMGEGEVQHNILNPRILEALRTPAKKAGFRLDETEPPVSGRKALQPESRESQ